MKMFKHLKRTLKKTLPKKVKINKKKESYVDTAKIKLMKIQDIWIDEFQFRNEFIRTILSWNTKQQWFNLTNSIQ